MILYVIQIVTRSFLAYIAQKSSTAVAKSIKNLNNWGMCEALYMANCKRAQTSKPKPQIQMLHCFMLFIVILIYFCTYHFVVVLGHLGTNFRAPSPRSRGFHGFFSILISTQCERLTNLRLTRCGTITSN